jgi:hypothetical protein
MTLALLFASMWLARVIAPDTPTGRFLHRWTVVVPAARLAAIRPGQVLLTVLVLTVVTISVVLIGEESTRLIGTATPEIAGWITMFEVTSYLDALVAVVSASSLWRLGRAPKVFRLPRRRATGRERRSRASRPSAANDAKDGPDRLVAA